MYSRSPLSLVPGKGTHNQEGKRGTRSGDAAQVCSPVWLATSAREKFWGFCRMRKVSAGPTTLPGKGGHSVKAGNADPLPTLAAAQSPLSPWHQYPHLMLMKLAVERRRCLARSSSSCTPAASPRGLWGQCHSEEGVAGVRAQPCAPHSQGAGTGRLRVSQAHSKSKCQVGQEVRLW